MERFLCEIWVVHDSVIAKIRQGNHTNKDVCALPTAHCLSLSLNSTERGTKKANVELKDFLFLILKSSEGLAEQFLKEWRSQDLEVDMFHPIFCLPKGGMSFLCP